MSDSLQPHGLYSPWNSLGQNTGEGSLSLLQGIFPTQGSNPGLPHWGPILYQLSHHESPKILERVAYRFPRGSSWPRNWARVSCIVGGFFTRWAFREAMCVCVCVCVCVMGLFIYLAALGLSRGMRILHCSTFSSCGTQADSVVALLGLSCSAACGILVPQPRIKPTFPALQCRFLTTETPRESHDVCIMLILCHHQVLCYRKRLEM